MSQLERLARPVPEKYVRPPAKGKYGSYVPHEVINQILLAIVGPFDFKVEQIVYGADGMVEGITASMTLLIDGREVTVTEIGDCEIPTNWKTQGARMKDAASDALKRCAMRFGCGLHLWSSNYFLFEQLSKPADNPPSVNPATAAVQSAPAPAAVAAYYTPGEASLATATSQCSSLAAIGVNIFKERTAAGLPVLAKMKSEEDWFGWQELLARLGEAADREAAAATA